MDPLAEISATALMSFLGQSVSVVDPEAPDDSSDSEGLWDLLNARSNKRHLLRSCPLSKLIRKEGDRK